MHIRQYSVLLFTYLLKQLTFTLYEFPSFYDLQQTPIWHHSQRLTQTSFHGWTLHAFGFCPESAAQALRDGKADLVSFGQLYLANPDLVERLQDNKELRSMHNVKDDELLMKYIYGDWPEGYTDVSVFKENNLILVNLY